MFRPNPEMKLPIPGSRIYCLLADTEDRVWIGTDHGITTVSTNFAVVRTFSRAEGLEGSESFSLAQTPEGTMWAGTEAGLFRQSGNRWERESGCPADIVLALAVAPDGTLWCGTYRSGLVALSGTRSRIYPPGKSGVPDTIFSSICCDQNGIVWAGTPSGLISFDGRSWRTYDPHNSGVPSHRIRSVVSRSNEVWAATSAGVTRYTAARAGQAGNQPP